MTNRKVINMTAVKVNVTDKFQANSMQLKGMMFSVEIEPAGNGTYYLYGSQEKINSCLRGLPAVKVVGEYDAVESQDAR